MECAEKEEGTKGRTREAQGLQKAYGEEPGSESKILVSAPWLYLAFKNLKVRLALYLQDSDQPPLEARQRMIHQDVIAWHIELEFDDGCAAGRHGDGLHAARRRALQVS